MPPCREWFMPAEILTDNGSQYVTWRGKSVFTKELEKRGVKQIVAAQRRPQTLGKIERFWGTLWRECIASAVFVDLGDARQRIGLFIDHYNFQRPHQGIDGLAPADRFFGAASEVRRTLAARVQANALELAGSGGGDVAAAQRPLAARSGPATSAGACGAAAGRRTASGAGAESCGPEETATAGPCVNGSASASGSGRGGSAE